MAERKPVVLVSGQLKELPAGDTLPPQAPASHSHATSDVTGLDAALSGKEPTISAGTTAQYWRGDKAWRDFFTDVRAATLTGLSTATNSAITADDTVLVAHGKLQAQMNAKLDKTGGGISGNVSIPSLNGGQLAGMRNKIINGNFDVWQRGTSLTVSSAFSSGGFIADRFLSAADAGSSGSFTVSQQVFTPGQTAVPFEPSYFYRMATSSFANGTNGFLYLAQQRVEDVRTFAGQTVTLSFYARASVAATIGVSMTQTFGSGGSSSVIFGGQTLALTTSFQKFTLTFSVPSIAGKTIVANSYLALEIFAALRGTTATAYGVTAFTASANGSYDIAQIQLEVGSVATPFEHRPYGMELALCQRYLPVVSGPTIVGSGWCISGTQCYVEVPHQVPPRVPPTGITATAASGFNLYSNAAASLPCTSVAFNGGGTLMSRLSVQVASGLTQGQATGMFATGQGEKIIFTGCEL